LSKPADKNQKFTPVTAALQNIHNDFSLSMSFVFVFKCTWTNVQRNRWWAPGAMWAPGKLELLENEMERCRFDILGLAEM